jgi:hypothetical protein
MGHAAPMNVILVYYVPSLNNRIIGLQGGCVMKKTPDVDLFVYDPTRRRSPRVTRRYLELRMRSGSMRCDNEACGLYTRDYTTGLPMWNGKPITLIVDHIDGCRHNNCLENLRLLCPNCNIQQPTRGKRHIDPATNAAENRYREVGYSVKRRDGAYKPHLFPSRPTVQTDTGTVAAAFPERPGIVT